MSCCCALQAREQRSGASGAFCYARRGKECNDEAPQDAHERVAAHACGAMRDACSPFTDLRLRISRPPSFSTPPLFFTINSLFRRYALRREAAKARRLKMMSADAALPRDAARDVDCAKSACRDARENTRYHDTRVYARRHERAVAARG